MPKQAKSYAPRIQSSTWEQHRCRIKTLFVDQNETLSQVMESMKSYGLHATESQYERQMKIWDIRKNCTRDEWRLVNREVEGRHLQGKASTVSINGVEQSKEKLDREFARSEYRRYGGLQPGLPDHIQVSSPPATVPATEMSTRSPVDPEAELVPPALQDLYHNGEPVQHHLSSFLLHTRFWDKEARKMYTTHWVKLVDLGHTSYLLAEEPELECSGVIAPKHVLGINPFDRL